MTSSGIVSTGGLVSTTVTEKPLVPVFLYRSVDVHWTVVSPRANVDPDAGMQLAGRSPPLGSFADATKLTAAPVGPVASAVIGPGTDTIGGVVSRTIIVNDALPMLS